MRRDIVGALRDIHNAAQNIVEDTAGLTFDEFVGHRRTHQAVERNFEIMGGAANRLRNREPSVAARITSLNQIIAFRNILILGYDTIDYEIVWQAIQESLPILRAEVEQVLRETEERS